MLQLVLPLVILELILKAVALVDLTRRETVEVRGGRKWPWALAIIVISTLGPVAYFIWGREEGLG